jgi:hypothetical protein
VNQRIAAVPIEPGAALATPDRETDGCGALDSNPGSPSLPRCDLRQCGAQDGAAARGLDRDRRRLRRTGGGLPGAGRSSCAGSQAGSRDPLRRDTLGDDARDAARARAGTGRRDRWHARRQDHRSEGTCDPGRWRVSGRCRATGGPDRV